MRKSLCFVGALTLTLSVLLCALMVTVTKTERLETALLQTVEGFDAQTLTAFAQHTMPYLRGETDAWQPDVPFAVGEDFALHMAQVRDCVKASLWVIILGTVIGAGLIGLGGLWRKPVLLGMLAALVCVAGAFVWALADFSSFWQMLHQWFIPGGIFSPDEPMMQLFPPKLFAAYLRPVAIACGAAFSSMLLLASICLKKEASK